MTKISCLVVVACAVGLAGASGCGDDTTGGCEPLGAEQCDGIDNTCDGVVDEGCACVEGDAQDCYSGDPDLLGIGVCVGGMQSCDIQGAWGDCAGEVLPGDEVCDGLDNDCDSRTDDTGTVTCGTGICEVTTLACEGGEPVDCQPGEPNPVEACDGTDDDCDGTVDEDCACDDGQEQGCYTAALETRNVGECRDGLQTCTGGQWSACADDQTPVPEICNGTDDDCDAAIDEDCACEDDQEQGCYTASALTRGVGECRDGVQACTGGSWGACQGERIPAAETCNGLDDDCDAVTDNDNPEGGGDCDTGLDGLCAVGTEQCVDGALVCGQYYQPSDDVCDGIDNDCDPSTPDGSGDPAAGVACDGPDSDLCEEGTSRCVDGVIECDDASDSTEDLCNGEDDDCDPASADGSEDPLMGAACDGADSDLCEEGVLACLAGAPACDDATGDDLDLCNGLDDDCDAGSPDGSDDPAVGVACDGPDSDLCAEGLTVCQDGAPVCDDVTGDELDLCNGADDDCDPASADGSEDPLMGMPCDGPDSDLCFEGVTSCQDGAPACDDATGDDLDLCNGLDDDCDTGSPDGSGDPLIGVPCDGPDSDLCTEGLTVCQDGAQACDDASGDDLDLCNGADDDCDPTSADGSEDPLVGAPCDGPDNDLCTEGVTSCPAGSPVCDDTTADDLDLCNGADDDCDPSSADGSEDPLVGTPCDGPDSDLCLEGVTACPAGTPVCDDATGDDLDLCNGVNDDCDPASADGSEDPLVGAPCDGPDSDLCTEGVTTCPAGSPVCDDVTGDDVDLCNGTDDDCDPSSADGSEDPLIGVVCDGPDSDLCFEGVTVCTAGAPACNDTTGDDLDLCNGFEDDCDPSSPDGSEDPAIGVPCDGPDSDFCEEGVTICTAGSPACGDTTGDTIEICGNGIDEDCDGVPDDNCCSDPVQDGGFELGTPNPQWAETSTNFGTPLCTVANCGTGTGTGPYLGTWWAWFGGATDEDGSVSQTMVIPVGADTLRFQMELAVCESGTWDWFRIYVDGSEVYYTDGNDPQCNILGYQQRNINIAAYADGASHTIMFRGTNDVSNTTNFFVDNVELVCD